MQSLTSDNNIALDTDREKENSEIDLKIKEEDKLILKQKDIFRRKSSYYSTTISKSEDSSELSSCPNCSKNNNTFQELNDNNNYIYKIVRNNNQIFNYYQFTLEYYNNNLSENQNYIKTKN